MCIPGLAFGSTTRFYIALGIDPSPREPMTLMVTLTDVRAVLSGHS
jgi:hypothetical protein